MKLLEFNLPKLKAMDVNLEADVKQKIEKITVEIKNKQDGKEKD